MQPASSKKNLLFILKLAFGISLLVVLVLQVDLGTLLSRLYDADPFLLALMFLLPHLGILISTVKWQILLKTLGLHIGLGRLFDLYLIGTFFSNFLPSMVGGDVVRAYVLGRDTERVSAVFAATFLERYIGLAGLVSLLPLALTIDLVHSTFPVLWVFVPAVVVGFLLSAGLVVSPQMVRLRRRYRHIRLLSRPLHFLARTHIGVYRVSRSVGSVIVAFFLSVLFYLTAAGAVWAAAHSLGAEVSLIYLTATVPLVLLIALLPISLNGLGITEAGFVVVLQLVGVSLVDAVGVGLLLRARVLITAILGGLVFLKYRSADDTSRLSSSESP